MKIAVYNTLTNKWRKSGTDITYTKNNYVQTIDNKKKVFFFKIIFFVKIFKFKKENIEFKFKR